MNIFTDTPADNLRHIADWHDRAHGGPWPECAHLPCSVTTPTFRANWANKDGYRK